MAACMLLSNTTSLSALCVRPARFLSRGFSAAAAASASTQSAAPSAFTFPVGFKAAGVRCGIKKKKGASMQSAHGD